MSATEEIADYLYQRWGMSARPAITSKSELGNLTAAALGLKALLGDDLAAERQWLSVFRRELDGSAYKAILQGRYEDVLRVVNNERVP